MSTPSCKRVWEAILKTSKIVSPELAKELQDSFCDFECAWKEHAFEYHEDENVLPKQ